MLNKKTMTLGVNIFFILIFGLVACAERGANTSQIDAGDKKTAITELNWGDLIPEDFVQPENPFTEMSKQEVDVLLDGSAESNATLQALQDAFSYAPVVEALDGKRIRIAAYIAPLSFDGDTKMKEFLLVPYLGACIHTPPPPANQVVHAQSPEAIELGSIYDPVWAIGTIKAETVESDLAQSGYKLEVEQVLPYEK